MSETDRQLAEAWFRKAENDLLNARNNLAADLVPFDTVCFHCQQMAEKYSRDSSPGTPNRSDERTTLKRSSLSAGPFETS